MEKKEIPSLFPNKRTHFHKVQSSDPSCELVHIKKLKYIGTLLRLKTYKLLIEKHGSETQRKPVAVN
jgi:hypothetical protein